MHQPSRAPAGNPPSVQPEARGLARRDLKTPAVPCKDTVFAANAAQPRDCPVSAQLQEHGFSGASRPDLRATGGTTVGRDPRPFAPVAGIARPVAVPGHYEKPTALATLRPSSNWESVVCM
jgi:hypothetical protein